MKKKYLALGLCVVLSLSACGGQKATQEPAQEPDQKVVQQTEPAPQAKEIKEESPIEPEAPAEENAVEEVTPVEEDETVETVDLFTSCEETVYATGSVNIRASWSAESEKLGALNKGDSLTRIGIGTGEAENWSRVTLADSSTAYISSKYLSTSKPATSQVTNNNNENGTTQQTPADAGLSREGWVQLPNGTWYQGELPSGTGPSPSGQQQTWTGAGSRTKEEVEKGIDKSADIMQGRAQLKWDENGVPYYD